jgi:hypothetical protein
LLRLSVATFVIEKSKRVTQSEYSGRRNTSLW